jgi:hypothetical protein
LPFRLVSEASAWNDCPVQAAMLVRRDDSRSLASLGMTRRARIEG